MKLKIRKYGLFYLLICLLNPVYSQSSGTDDTQQIVDKAIKAHGGKAYDNLNVAFTFRTKKYTIKLNNGLFKYTRSFSNDTGTYLDKLTNDRFERSLDGEVVVLSEKDTRRFSNSVNSVVYFTLLPKGLNDPAANKTLIGTTKIKGEDYHLIEVKFDEEGGGDDHDDTFAYWINVKTYTVDYLAYSFHVNGGGVRFREAINPVEVGGVRFQNYINYSPASKDTPLDKLPRLFEEGSLKKLSEIINEDMRIGN